MEKIYSFNSIRLKLNYSSKLLTTYYWSIKNSPNLIKTYYTKIYQITRWHLQFLIDRQNRQKMVETTELLQQPNSNKSYQTNVCPLRNSEISNRLSWAYRRKFHGHWRYRESCYTYRHGNLQIHPPPPPSKQYLFSRR